MTLTDHGSVMFDAVMHVDIAQVECAGPVVPGQHVCGELGNEEAERRSEVVCLANASIQLPESDTATTAGKDT